MFAAPIAQFRLGKILVRQSIFVPQIQHADVVGLLIGKSRMRRIGRLARVGRSLTRILGGQERREHKQFAQARKPLRFDQHARQRDVDRQSRHLPADCGQLVKSAAMDGRFLIFRDHRRSHE